MPPEPLRPEDVDALLAPNVRTTVADLLSARDSLLRARAAFESLALAVEHLRQASARAQNAARTLEAEVKRRPARRAPTSSRCVDGACCAPHHLPTSPPTPGHPSSKVRRGCGGWSGLDDRRPYWCKQTVKRGSNPNAGGVHFKFVARE